MKKHWKRPVFYTFLVILLIFILLSWYKVRYSMEPARPYEVNQPTLEKKILIATQGSKYKNSIVSMLVNTLRPYPIYMKIIDVSDLNNITEDKWTVIILLHTWENWEPQQDVQQFLESSQNLDKIIVLATSGSGDLMIEGIDGITSASTLTDIPRDLENIMSRIEAFIDLNSL